MAAADHRDCRLRAWGTLRRMTILSDDLKTEWPENEILPVTMDGDADGTDGTDGDGGDSDGTDGGDTDGTDGGDSDGTDS